MMRVQQVYIGMKPKARTKSTDSQRFVAGLDRAHVRHVDLRLGEWQGSGEETMSRRSRSSVGQAWPAEVRRRSATGAARAISADTILARARAEVRQQRAHRAGPVPGM